MVSDLLVRRNEISSFFSASRLARDMGTRFAVRRSPVSQANIRSRDEDALPFETLDTADGPAIDGGRYAQR